jgi:hypothetical protein
MTAEHPLPDPPFEFEKLWPPPGHSVTYTAKLDLDGFAPFEYQMTAPSGVTHLSSLIVDRLDGASKADEHFRSRLYLAMGKLAVASGHVETAMKRLLIVLRGLENSFALVDETWTKLEETLKVESTMMGADASYPEIRTALGEHLLWARQRHLKTHRNDFIHGSIWDFDMPVLLVSRFTRKSDGASIVSSIEDLERVARRMVEYDARLCSLLHGIWGEAMLPAVGSATNNGHPVP